MKKIRVLIIAVLIMSMLNFVACGKKENDQNENTVSNNEQEGDNFNEEGYPIVNEPVTLKAMLVVRDTDSLTPINEMKVIKDLEEKTGIHIEWEVVKGSDRETKMNLMFASGEYPDLILSVNAGLDYEEYGVSQGIILSVDELTSKYMPNYTERINMETNDPTVSLIASDGKKYAVGNLVSQNISVYQHFFINQVWLDNLGLQTPKTIEELTDVLRAFKLEDPNGNGEADEIPVEMALTGGSYSIRQMLPMFSVPAASSGKWIYIDENKEVKFAATEEGYRECLEWLSLLYKEGLLDPEVISQDINTVQTKLQAGDIGLFTAWRLTAMGFEDGVLKDSKLYIPPTTKSGKPSFHRYLEMAKPGAFITVSNKNIPATMRWLDALIETETMFSLYYGQKDIGWEYNKENGKIDSLSTDYESVMDFFASNTLFFAPPTYLSETFNMSPQRIEKTEYSQVYEEAGIVQKYSNQYLEMAPLNAEQISKMKLKETDLENAVIENAAAFITKGVTDDSWNAYVELINSIGIEEYIETYQEAIDQMDLD